MLREQHLNSERQKSAREKLEERLDHYRLKRELSELWAA